MRWLTNLLLLMMSMPSCHPSSPSSAPSAASPVWNNFRNSFDSTELYFVIDTVEYAQEIFYTSTLMNQMNVIWLTYDVDMDPYIKLYLEYILELTKDMNPIQIMIRNLENDLHLLPKIIQILPKNSIFLIIEDADVRLNLCSLYSTLQFYSKELPIIFHLNHETPWIKTVMGYTNSGKVCSSDELNEIYSKYRHVFRNYYSNRYQTTSDFVPLLSKQGRRLQQYRQENSLLRSSLRENWCIFSGRIKYDHTRQVSSIFHADRSHFIDLISTSQYPNLPKKNCRAYYDNSGIDGHQHSFTEYMNILAHSVFTPCPAGNNPETFRHYEAMELGSIPIFIRPPPEVDFLTMWTDYPGPIFTTWEEALEFIVLTTPSEVDLLQDQIMKWYEIFRENVSVHFSLVVKEKFGLSPNSPRKTISAESHLKTNAPVTAAIQAMQFSQTRYHTKVENMELKRNIEILMKEVKELRTEQARTLNLLSQLINQSCLSSV